MYVLVETDSSTKKSDSFTFGNFEELHTWVTTRVPEESRKLNSLQGFLGELLGEVHSWATKHKADQNIIQSFMNHFNLSQVLSTVVEGIPEETVGNTVVENSTETVENTVVENRTKTVENTVEETDSGLFTVEGPTGVPENKESIKEPMEKCIEELDTIFHWNIPAVIPRSRLDFRDAVSARRTFSRSISDLINSQFSITDNLPTELKPLEIISQHVFDGYGKEIAIKQDERRSIEIVENGSNHVEYSIKEHDANIKLNEFCKWFGNTFIEKINPSKHNFREYTKDGNFKYKDVYSETSVKMCMLLTAIFGKKVLVASRFEIDTNGKTIRTITHNTEMPSEFDTIFDMLTPMHIYHKLCMSITSPYDTIKWETNFIPYFQILRGLRSIEPANHDGKWETLAFKLTARYIIELFDIHHVSKHFYPDYMSDIVQAFITLNLKQSDNGSIQSSELYASFTKFIEAAFMNDIPELIKLCKRVISPNINSKMFANELKANGIQSVRKSAGIFYTGIEASKEGDTKKMAEKPEPQPFDVFESASWKGMYGSGTALEYGDFSEKLIKKKPAVVAAPKVTNIRDGLKTAAVAPKPNLSVLE